MLDPTRPKNQVLPETPLSGPQIDAVEHGEGPLLVAAGAGSGKTRTLTQRIAYLIKNGTRPQRIVAITFTNKAADEMRSRITGDAKKYSKHSPFIGTFHSFGAQILRKEAKYAKRESNYVIFDDGDSMKLIKRIVKSQNIQDKKHSPRDVRKKISKVKNMLLDASTLDEETRLVYEQYETDLLKFNAFDFDDLIEKVVKIFQEHPEILKKHQDKYSYVLVDEYQDINTCQYVLLKLLGEKHKNVTVVGDDQQSIYGFRWSDFTNFLNFESDWPKAKIVKLGQNYRSTGTIVNAAASVIKNNKLQRSKRLWTENSDGDPISVVGTENAEDEADVVVLDIIKRDVSGSNVAILYRTNAQSRAIEQSLNIGSIPYKIFGGIRFYERLEIKDVMAALRYASNQADEISKDRLDKAFRKKVYIELIENLPNLAKELTVMELIGFFLKTTDYFDYLKRKFDNFEERIENISELIEFANSFSSLQEFIERVSLLQANDTVGRDLPGRIVNLMTIHLAKGLEFDEVYIVGMSEGLLPHQKSLFSDEDIEEERRLAYVAMTRARHRLHLSFYETASRFLYEIPPELIEFRTSDVESLGKDIFVD